MDGSNFKRKEYEERSLRRSDLATDPFEQFQLWITEAIDAEVVEPNAMNLATASAEGHPSSRMVLLKNVSTEGIFFFTNYESRKAKELVVNPYASATFWWKELERQVIVEGSVHKTSRETSAHYFSKRPRRSQISALISSQDKEVESRQILEEAFKEADELYKGKEIPLPEFWGGFCLVPKRFEFWQGRPDRLHDRFAYTAEGSKWKIQRLSS